MIEQKKKKKKSMEDITPAYEKLHFFFRLNSYNSDITTGNRYNM